LPTEKTQRLYGGAQLAGVRIVAQNGEGAGAGRIGLLTVDADQNTRAERERYRQGTNFSIHWMRIQVV